MIHPESIPVFSWRDGFIALKGGGKAGAAGIAHLPADFRNGIGGSFQQPLCLADACFVDIINQLDSRAALKHMGQIGRADPEAVTDHGCAEIGIAGLGMNIIRDLGDVFSNVEAEGVIVIVQLLKAGMDQRNPLLKTFGIFDALGLAVDFGAADVSGVPRHVQYNQHPFNPNCHAGKKRELQVQG